MEETEISEAATLMLAVDCVASRLSDVEPECFINAGVCCGIATFAGDPEGALSVCETYVFVVVRIADFEGDESGDVLQDV